MGVSRSGDVVDLSRSRLRADGQGERTVGFRVDVLIHHLFDHLAPSVLARQPRQKLQRLLDWLRPDRVSSETVVVEVVYRKDAENVVDIGHEHLTGRHRNPGPGVGGRPQPLQTGTRGIAIDGVDHAGIDHLVHRMLQDSFSLRNTGIGIGGKALSDQSHFRLYRLAGQQAQGLAIQRFLVGSGQRRLGRSYQGGGQGQACRQCG